MDWRREHTSRASRHTSPLRPPARHERHQLLAPPAHPAISSNPSVTPRRHATTPPCHATLHRHATQRSATLPRHPATPHCIATPRNALPSHRHAVPLATKCIQLQAPGSLQSLAPQPAPLPHLPTSSTPHLPTSSTPHLPNSLKTALAQPTRHEMRSREDGMHLHTGEYDADRRRDVREDVGRGRLRPERGVPRGSKTRASARAPLRPWPRGTNSTFPMRGPHACTTHTSHQPIPDQAWTSLSRREGGPESNMSPGRQDRFPRGMRPSSTI